MRLPPSRFDASTAVTTGVASSAIGLAPSVQVEPVTLPPSASASLVATMVGVPVSVVAGSAPPVPALLPSLNTAETSRLPAVPPAVGSSPP